MSPRILTLALAFFLAAGPLAIASDNEFGFLRPYAGDPYTGFLEVRVEPPGGKGWTRYGRGSAHFADIDSGHAKLVVFGAIDDESGDAGFAIDGRFDDSGWASHTANVTLRLTPGGEIVGQGTVPPQSFRFSGAVTELTFDLEVLLEITEATAKGLPAGTTFQFSYDLSRGAPEAEDEAGDEGGGKEAAKGTCRKIRYEMRPVANIGEGSMSMIQIPVCLH